MTVVTDHRMAFSVSTSQTVLWDQIEYSGSPKDFSWVLPVKSGTVVQLSNDQWFSALDAMTQPAITGPNRPCNGGGAGCGSSSSAAGSVSDYAGGSGVQVLDQSVVGPYDTATLRATDPNALENWLSAHGYVLPQAMKPTVDSYVAGGFDFIALRLQPGFGVQAMQPVRVVTQGSDLTLPLRMVAAGVGAQVGVTLYVISEGRYEVGAPFSNATIDDSQLFWLHAQNRSNYQELSHSIMQGNGGRTWLTEYSQPMSLNPNDPTTCSSSAYNYYGSTLGGLYLSNCCPPPVTSPSSSSGGFVGQNPFFDAAPEVATEAGEDTSVTVDAASEASPTQTAPGQGSQGPSSSTTSPVCTGDDFEVALTGLHLTSVWVTRLRAILPASALSEHDLVLQASESQTAVTNRHNANNYDDPSYTPCGTTGGGGCAAAGSDSRGLGPWVEAGALCVLAASALRRRRSRRVR